MRATLLLVVVNLIAMLESLLIFAMQIKFNRNSLTKVRRRGRPVVMVPCARAGTNKMGFLKEKYEQIIELNPLQNTNEHAHQTNSTHKNWSNKPPRHQSIRHPTIRPPTLRPQTLRPQTIRPQTSDHPTPQTEHQPYPKKQANTTHQKGKKREKTRKGHGHHRQRNEARANKA